MGQTYGRVGRIDTLSTVTGRTEHIKFTVIQIQLEVDLFRLRHDRYGNGGSMDTSAGFGLRYTLYTVYTALILQTGIRTRSVDHKGNFLETADSVFVQGHQFGFPSAGLCVFYIHPVDLRCK